MQEKLCDRTSTAVAGQAAFYTFLALSGASPPLVQTAARLVTGSVLPLHPPDCQRPAPSPPSPRGGGENSGEEGGRRPRLIKAAGPALPARPRRPDPRLCLPPHVTALLSELGRVPMASPDPPEPRGSLNPGGEESGRRRALGWDTRSNALKLSLRSWGSRGTQATALRGAIPARGLGDLKPLRRNALVVVAIPTYKPAHALL